MTFKQLVERYSAYKKRKTGSSEISLKERASLRNAYMKMSEGTSKKSSRKSFRENIGSECTAWDFKDDKAFSMKPWKGTHDKMPWDDKLFYFNVHRNTVDEFGNLVEKEGFDIFKDVQPVEVWEEIWDRAWLNMEKACREADEAGLSLWPLGGELKESSRNRKTSFEKFVESYKSYKKRKTGSSKITFKEYKSLKNEFGKTSMKEGKSKTSNKFTKFVESYRSYKKQKTGSSKITFKEYESLKKEFRKVSMKEDISSKRSSSFEKFVESYKSYKKQKTGESKVSFKEYNSLKKAFKEQCEGDECDAQGSEVEEMTERSKMFAKKKIREANYHLRLAKRAFKENDMAAIEDGLGDATVAVDAAAQAVDGAAPADLTAQIQSVITAVDQLAQAAGLVPQDDMTADIDAGVPAVEGQPVDPNAQMLESNRVERARNRIKNAINEEVTVPSEGKVAKGVSKYAGKVWKPASVKYARTGSLTEREDEAMVDELLNEKKLDYKELFSKGILG